MSGLHSGCAKSVSRHHTLNIAFHPVPSSKKEGCRKPVLGVCPDTLLHRCGRSSKPQDRSGRGYVSPTTEDNPTSPSGQGQDIRRWGRHQALGKTSGQGQDKAPSFSGPVTAGMAQTDDDRRGDSVAGVFTDTCQSVRQHDSRGRNERLKHW